MDVAHRRLTFGPCFPFCVASLQYGCAIAVKLLPFLETTQKDPIDGSVNYIIGDLETLQVAHSELFSGNNSGPSRLHKVGAVSCLLGRMQRSSGLAENTHMLPCAVSRSHVTSHSNFALTAPTLVVAFSTGVCCPQQAPGHLQ